PNIGQLGLTSQHPQKSTSSGWPGPTPQHDHLRPRKSSDEADTSYALTLAAEFTERAGDLPGAQVLAERAAEVNRVHGDPNWGYPQAFNARLLLQLGRDDEGLAELTALRPLLSEKIDAVSYVCGALEQAGGAELAQQWVTTALFTALQRQKELDSQRQRLDFAQARVVGFTLAQYRHRLRRELGLRHDDYDDLADNLQAAFSEALAGLVDEEQGYQGFALLFWPRPEFDALLLRWPALTEVYGQTWDEYRITLQRRLVQLAESGHPRLAVAAGSVDELAHHAERNGGDPVNPQVRQDYAENLNEHQWRIWPPGRNESCWCGSGVKYKKCCLPRARS
ncbi:MAG: SEC-C domain-containing protein, partial [Actinobacteria bacterium]|nr:SEC-C domain-containing protein [Actinomycetota bacterium]